MKKKIFQKKARIIQNKKAGEGFFEVTLDAPHISASALPGQFIMVKADNPRWPLLRRPLGIHKARKNTVTLLYQVVGPGTRMLAGARAGENLDILGPLGNGFDQSQARLAKKVVLVAGGMGVAPLLFLAQKLDKKVLVLIGAKDKNHLICEKEFRALGHKTLIATDDGSRGFKGFVTDMLEGMLRSGGAGCQAIYACGPGPMLEKVAQISARCKAPAQVSLERHMACGFGACLGCAVDTVDGKKRVCKDGPVFFANQIIWGKE